jgi:hypothetical protein
MGKNGHMIAAFIFGLLSLFFLWLTVVAASFGLWGVPIGCVTFMAACVLYCMARNAADFALGRQREGSGIMAQTPPAEKRGRDMRAPQIVAILALVFFLSGYVAIHAHGFSFNKDTSSIWNSREVRNDFSVSTEDFQKQYASPHCIGIYGHVKNGYIDTKGHNFIDFDRWVECVDETFPRENSPHPRSANVEIINYIALCGNGVSIRFICVEPVVNSCGACPDVTYVCLDVYGYFIAIAFNPASDWINNNPSSVGIFGGALCLYKGLSGDISRIFGRRGASYASIGGFSGFTEGPDQKRSSNHAKNQGKKGDTSLPSGVSRLGFGSNCPPISLFWDILSGVIVCSAVCACVAGTIIPVYYPRFWVFLGSALAWGISTVGVPWWIEMTVHAPGCFHPFNIG